MLWGWVPPAMRSAICAATLGLGVVVLAGEVSDVRPRHAGWTGALCRHAGRRGQGRHSQVTICGGER